jgi:hypothetical protein
MKRAALAIFVALAAPAIAQDLPQFRKGMWEFNRTVSTGAGEPQALNSRKCVNPTDELRKQNEMLAQVGCKASTVTRRGNSYSFGADCTVNGVAVQSRSVITVESDSAYRVSVESKQGTRATRETLVARRVADC